MYSYRKFVDGWYLYTLYIQEWKNVLLVSYMAGDFLSTRMEYLCTLYIYISRSGRMSSYRSLVDGW